MPENYFIEVLDELKAISQTTTSVDLKIHKRYTEKDLKTVRKEIEEKLADANRLFFSLAVKEDEITDINSELEKQSKWIKKDSVEKELGENWNVILELIRGVTKTAEANKKIYDEIDKNFCDLKDVPNKSDFESRKASENRCYGNLFKLYNKLQYNFQTARYESKNYPGIENFDENTGTILLCKNVRIMEDLINKICTNNIDKSIIGGEQHFDSIKYGFEWLFCHEDLSESNTYKKLDIRDRNRFLDYIKYQIMVASKYVKASDKDSKKIDSLFERIKFVFDAKEFEEKTDIIAKFKKRSKTLINDFFNVYELLINYRDALFHEEEIRKSLQSENSEFKTLDSFIAINPFITNLSSIAVRVLLDRFVSFVKISDLNFGNSTFNRAWFNYSELSKSNYAGSNFKYARIENAKMKECDISTCNLILADGDHTDFSYSNFNFSNLSGISLADAIVNYCEFQNAIFVDANIDNYKNAIEDTLKGGWDPQNKNNIRARRLTEVWKEDHSDDKSLRSSIRAIIKEYHNIDLKSLNFTKNSINSWAILQYNRARNDLLDKPAKIMKEITNLFLSKHISAELFQYMRHCFSVQSLENPEEKKRRIKKYGSILLDSANLINISAKYAQLGGSDLSHVIMSQSSFENADLSSVVMHYTSADTASFIYCNLNYAECFESDFLFSNLSSAVINNSLFLNCNLNHTNWNKAIIVGSIFADFSHYVDNIIADSDDFDLCLQTEKNFKFDDDKIIQDIPAYQNLMSHNQDNSLSKNKPVFWQRECSISDATFTDVLADNVVLLNIVTDRSTFNRAFFKNSFWANCRACLSDCIETDFRYSAFMFCCMGQSNFTNANLTSTKICYVDFSDCNLFSALFNLSCIDHVLFMNTNMRHVNFSNADIKNSAFENCKFEEIILAGTKFSNCIFSHVDFNNLIGYHSSEYYNCYFYDCSFKNQNIDDGIQNLRELFEI